MKYFGLIITFLVFLICFYSPVYAVDQFDCYKNCEAALVDSNDCKIGEDYTITIKKTTVNGNESDVVILSIHGGRIESKTSQISDYLANFYDWNLYDFSGHPSKKCKIKENTQLNNFEALHITSTGFNEPQALKLVQSHPKTIALHGYSDRREYDNGTICVGGLNEAQINNFIDYIENNNNFSQYELNPIKAREVLSRRQPCYDLKGESEGNIVNKNSRSMGLQLELSNKMRRDLDNKLDIYNELREVIYGAVFNAMMP